MLSALGVISVELLRFCHGNRTRSWWQKCQIGVKKSTKYIFTSSRKHEKSTICLERNLVLGKGPQGGTNSLQNPCGLGVVATWDGAMRMTRTHATIDVIIIGTFGVCAQRGNCAPDPVGSAQAKHARGLRFESWTCQIIFLSDFGTFL